MDGIEMKGCVRRIRQCAFELYLMEDDLADDDEAAWDLIEQEIQLKATFIYLDLSRVTANAKGDRKKALTDIGKNFFSLMNELDQAVKTRNLPLARGRYINAARALREVTGVFVCS